MKMVALLVNRKGTIEICSFIPADFFDNVLLPRLGPFPRGALHEHDEECYRRNDENGNVEVAVVARRYDES